MIRSPFLFLILSYSASGRTPTQQTMADLNAQLLLDRLLLID